MAESDAPGDGTAVAWDEDNSRRWLADIDDRERQLQPISAALFERARLQPGEAVLDVGCGSGVTTAQAAAAVAPEVAGHPAGPVDTGLVVGVDLSPSMIEAARVRHPSSVIEWLVADAQTHDFGAGRFDVVISRFGTMFFADPAVAFANLATASRPGGRLAMVVWQRRADIEFFAVPLTAVLETLDRLGVEHPPPAPDGTGPFSLSDPDLLRDLLGAAGWSDVSCQQDRRQVYLGGPGEVEHAVRTALHSAVIETVLAGQPEEVVDEVREALTELAVERHDGAGVPLATGLWVVTATRDLAASRSSRSR